MIPAIVIGRGGSKGFPGKNKYLINGHPMLSYPIRAARSCGYVDEVYFSTDDDELKNIAHYYGAKIINRPPELATDGALADDVFLHAFNHISDSLDWASSKHISEVVLMFANAPCIVSHMIMMMIEKIRAVDEADSCFTVSRYNMFSPYRMRVLDGHRSSSFLPQSEMIGGCDRNSGGDFFIYDCSCAVVTPRCLEFINYGYLPQKWLGRIHVPFVQETPALDIDYKWQLGQIQYWIDKHWKRWTPLEKKEDLTRYWRPWADDKNTGESENN